MEMCFQGPTEQTCAPLWQPLPNGKTLSGTAVCPGAASPAHGTELVGEGTRGSRGAQAGGDRTTAAHSLREVYLRARLEL